MKTIIEFKDGHTETVEDAAPSADPETGLMGFVEADNGVSCDDVPIALIKRVIFETEEEPDKVNKMVPTEVSLVSCPQCREMVPPAFRCIRCGGALTS